MLVTPRHNNWRKELNFKDPISQRTRNRAATPLGSEFEDSQRKLSSCFSADIWDNSQCQTASYFNLLKYLGCLSYQWCPHSWIVFCVWHVAPEMLSRSHRRTGVCCETLLTVFITLRQSEPLVPATKKISRLTDSSSTKEIYKGESKANQVTVE